MDILDQYNKDKPIAPSIQSGKTAMPDKPPLNLDAQIYQSRAILGELRSPKMVSWVFKHSGGALKTERQAAYILFTLACVIGLSAVLLLIKGIRGPYTQSGPGLTQQELEEYKKIQPF